MKIITLMLALILFLTGCEGATESENTTDSKWEYLMVSFGKTKFSSPKKVLAYPDLLLNLQGNEANIQHHLDILGQFGWEVISIVGSIGGDQAVVLKRKYDKERSDNEYKLIQEYKKPTVSKKEELVDLDEMEREKNGLLKLKRLEDFYRKRFENTELSKTSTFTIAYEHSGISGDIVITIESDLTDRFLINDNSYHGDEIKSYLKNFLSNYAVRHSELKSHHGISIHLKGSIKFKGEMIKVWSGGIEQMVSVLDWTEIRE